MKEKFLPIGTICTLKGRNRKVIIVGYFSIEYNGNAIMYDYSGLDYPKGLLANKSYSFNHSDIENIDYIGYISEEYKVLNKRLNGQLNLDETKNIKSNPFFKNIKFNENGVVIFEEIAKAEENKKDSINNNSTIQKSKINFNDKQNNVFFNKNTIPSNKIEDASNYKNWSIFKSIKFDENGVVIEAEEYTKEELEDKLK